MNIRPLTQADAPTLASFLNDHAEGSQHLLGLLNIGEAAHAHFIGGFEGNALKGVLAFTKSSLLLLQCPDPQLFPQLLARWSATTTTGAIGLVGMREQVEQAVALLGGETLPFRLNNTEQILSLPLDKLRNPPVREPLLCRPAVRDENERLYVWRMTFMHEAMRIVPTPELAEQVRADLEGEINAGHVVVLEREGEIIATGNIISVQNNLAQLGGLFVKPELRGQGYSRFVLAGLARQARELGFTCASLHTTSRHEATQRAAYSIGFKPYGDFGVVLFTQPVGMGTISPTA